jgi:hypothetical protein
MKRNIFNPNKVGPLQTYAGLFILVMLCILFALKGFAGVTDTTSIPPCNEGNTIYWHNGYYQCTVSSGASNTSNISNSSGSNVTIINGTLNVTKDITSTGQAPSDITSGQLATHPWVQAAINWSMATYPLNLGANFSGNLSFNSIGSGLVVSTTVINGAITVATVVTGGVNFAPGDLVTSAQNGSRYDSVLMVASNSSNGVVNSNLIVLYGGSQYASGFSGASAIASSVPFTYVLNGTQNGPINILYPAVNQNTGGYASYAQQFFLINNLTGGGTNTVNTYMAQNDTAVGTGVTILNGTNQAALIYADGVGNMSCVAGYCAHSTGNLTVTGNITASGNVNAVNFTDTSGSTFTNPTIKSGGLISVSFAGLPIPGQMLNFVASNVSNKVVNGSWTGLTLADNQGNPAYSVNQNISINYAVANAGGMCNNAVATNGVWLYFYAVCNSTNCNASCIDASLNAPANIGANYYARIGANILTSGQLLTFNKWGRSTRFTRTGFPASNSNIIGGGTITNAANVFNVASVIPSYATVIRGDAQIQSTVANQYSDWYIYSDNAGLFAQHDSAWIGVVGSGYSYHHIEENFYSYPWVKFTFNACSGLCTIGMYMYGYDE